MGGKEEQRAIINSELYWYGGLRDSNCHNTDPIRSVQEDEPTEPSNRHIHAFFNEEGQWTVMIDPIEGCLKGTVEIVAPTDTPDC